MKQEPTYEEALGRVEQIADALEKGDTDLDKLTEQLREAKDLLALCKKKLIKAENDINEILSEEDGTR